MKDERKTKKELITELRQLRKKIAVLEKPQKKPANITFTRDITERKVLEQELLANNARQTALLQSLPMAFYVAQPFGNFSGTWVSDQIEAISGFTPMQFMNNPDLWESRLYDEDRERVLDKYGQIIETGSITLEYRWKTADGTVKWFLDSAVLIRDEAGKPKEIAGSWLDITERKLSENALRESEKKLKSLFDSATDGIFIIDMDGNFVDINRTAHERLGYTRDEMLAMNIKDLNHPDFISIVPDRFDQIRNNRFAIFESAHMRKDGTVMPVEINSRLLDYEGNKVFFSFIRDITERKKTEMALKESEERFRSLVESTSDWIWEIDENGIYTYASPQVEDILGYTPDEVLGKSPFDLMSDDEGKKLAVEFKDTSRKRESFSMLENRNRHKSGHIVTLETSGVPVFDTEGNYKGYRGIDRDISKRKEAENALKESEERFRDLFENSPVSLWLEDLSVVKERIDELREDGIIDFEDFFTANPKEVINCASLIKVVDVNKAALDLYSAKSKEELIYNLDRTFRKESLDALKTNLVAVAEGMMSTELDTVTQTLNGAKIYSSIKWSVIPGFEDSLSRVLISITDITTQKLTEEMLRQREHMYRMLIESTSALAWEFNLDTMYFTYVSPQAEFITGYSPVEWTNFDFWKNLIIPEDRDWAPNFWTTETAKGLDHEFEYRIKTADDRIVWIRDIVTVIKEDDKPVKLRGFMFDVTERKNMEEEIRKGKNLESLGILAGGIAHDFNNLLTSILGNISLALSFTKPEDKISERLMIAENASLRAKDLTRQLLTFSRGGTPVKKVALITDIIKDASSFALSGSNIKCDYSFPEDLRPVEIDEGQIRQVIHNLVINARDAMPQGGTISISGRNSKVTVNNNLSLTEGNYVQISITDEGVGIPDNNISKVFDPYFTTKEMGVQKGMGLGLAICHSIIRSHDGTIVVESEVGKGTTFHFYLPASEKDIVQESREDSVDLKDVSGSGRVLIMDDDAVLRDIICIMLEEIGYEVEAAVDGQAAVNMYKNAINEGRAYDAVILDLTVPGAMGGKETVKELIVIDNNVKAIVSSGYGNDPVISNYKDYGFMGYIIKPYKIEELGTLLKNILQE
jgi:PAS domain S-box-containing protein